MGWPSAPAAGSHLVLEGGGPPPVSREDLRQAGSRHRYRYAPPPTPDAFWDMDLTGQ